MNLNTVIETSPEFFPRVNVEFSAAVTPELLAENRASRHKSCRLKFSKSKLERAAKKRKRDDSQYDANQS